MKISPTLRQLITSKLKEQDLSRSEVVQKIGYSNVSKGFNRLDHYLKTLSPPSDEFVSNLLSVLDIDGLAFHNAFIASRDNIAVGADTKAKQSFRPNIEVQLDFQPRAWFAAQIIHRQCTRLVPADIQNLPFRKELDTVNSIYKKHAENTACLADIQNHIVGFKYHRTFDSAMVFDRDLTLIDQGGH